MDQYGNRFTDFQGHKLPHLSLDQKAGSIWRPKWFLITRFIAVLGVAFGLLFADYIFNIDTIHHPTLWILTGLLLLTNIGYVLVYRFGPFCDGETRCGSPRQLIIFTIIQINLDLVLLTFMLHYAGGATNPFIVYYFFHTILSSILLPHLLAYIEASFAALLFSGMTVFEGLGWIKHYPLFCPGCHNNPIFILGICAAMISALLIAVYMATSIMGRLQAYQHDLEYALEETERLEMEKSRILNVVAHDLKSPVAAIETMVTSNLAVYGDEIPAPVREVLERIPVRTGYLLKFIKELLEYSRINAAGQLEMQFKELNFLPIVTATVEMYMNQAIQKNINISLNAKPDIPAISGNRQNLEHMVGNLISNAIQYTPQNGSVNIKVSADGTHVILTVADTGIGIPEGALPEIFKDFYRAPNAKKEQSTGTGLGLSISKAIVEKHNGSISVTSTEGEGTVFTVRLPAVKSS